MSKRRKIKEDDIRTIVPVETKNDPRPVLGEEIFPYQYGSSFMCGVTGSGKTTALLHMIKFCTDENTRFYIFCGTRKLDKTWKEIEQFLKDRGNRVVYHDKIIDDGRKNILRETLDDLKDECEEEERNGVKRKKPEEQFFKFMSKDDIEEDGDIVQKEKKKPYKTARNWIILDDQNKYHLRHPTVVDAVKVCRHYKGRMVINGHASCHLQPDVLTNLMQICLWTGICRKYIESIAKNIDIRVDHKQLLQLYDRACQEKTDFLQIRPRELWNEFRKNFEKNILTL